jgi:hypothetical protein
MIILLYRYTRHPQYIYPPPAAAAPLRRSSIDPAHVSVPAASTATLHPLSIASSVASRVPIIQQPARPDSFLSVQTLLCATHLGQSRCSLSHVRLPRGRNTFRLHHVLSCFSCRNSIKVRPRELACYQRRVRSPSMQHDGAQILSILLVNISQKFSHAGREASPIHAA